LTLLSAQLLAQETASQLFLAPSAVPEAIYTPIDLSTPGSQVFNASQVPGGTVINDVAVCPVLLPNPSNPVDGSYTDAQLAAINFGNESTYFADTPTVDYLASNPGGASDTVTFNQEGVYYVQLQTNAGDEIFQVAVSAALASEPGPAQIEPTGPDRIIDPPPNNSTTIISTGAGAGDKAMTNAMTQLPGAQTASTTGALLDDCYYAWMANGFNKVEVSIVGHGCPGLITIGSSEYICTVGNPNLPPGAFSISDSTFQQDIDEWVSSVHFYSCSTGYGALGALFLDDINLSMTSTTAYTGPIWIDTHNFYADAAGSLLVSCPEPSCLALLGIGAIGLLGRRRRAA
jgi:hypothetical protein